MKFNYSEKVAITVENGVICRWASCYADSHLFYETRLFKNSKGKAILFSDAGNWWERERKEAPHCWHAELWMGDFPYESWAWCVRQCKSTGEVVITSISTDINPRGLTQQDKFRQECQIYVPESVAV